MCAWGAAVPRILVVDDDDPIRESIRLALAIIGIEVVTAENGERALEAFGQMAVDGAIVDLMMPGMNGLDTIRALRERAPALPIVVISGSLMQQADGGQDALRVATAMTGVTALAKPFKLSELMALARERFVAVPQEPATKPAA
jgi:CheY-like chemotaxis protein